MKDKETWSAFEKKALAVCCSVFFLWLVIFLWASFGEQIYDAFSAKETKSPSVRATIAPTSTPTNTPKQVTLSKVHNSKKVSAQPSVNPVVKMLADSTGRTVEEVIASGKGIRPTPRPTPEPTPYVLISMGSRDENTYDVQYILTALGYDLGAIDGIFGTKTEAALKRFQRDYGLSVNGLGDEPTIRKLVSVYERAGSPEVIEYTQTPQQEYVYYVYITRYGARYHSIPNCGNTKYATQVTYDYAVQCGYTACGNCY